MRLSGLLLVGFALAHPAPAPAQEVKPADIVGAWRGNVVVAIKAQKKDSVWKGTSQIILRPDSLWWERKSGLSWGMLAGGRWRLTGDSLWLAADSRYGAWIQEQREASRRTGGETREQRQAAGTTAGDPSPATIADTSGLGTLPKSDSLFWSEHLREYHDTTQVDHPTKMYKITFKDQQLSLFNVDSLAKNPQAAPVTVYKPAK